MRTTLIAAMVAAAASAMAPSAAAQQQQASDQGSVLLTIIFRHDQSKPLDQIQAELRQQGFYKAFPPAGIEVISWYVMMGIGQVVTLKVPAARLREVNLAVERTAWGAYRTEFYATYDYRAVAEEERRKDQ